MKKKKMMISLNNKIILDKFITMSDLYIQKYIWNKKLSNIFLKSCKELFNLENIQFYNPIYSLFFHIFVPIIFIWNYLVIYKTSCWK